MRSILVKIWVFWDFYYNNCFECKIVTQMNAQQLSSPYVSRCWSSSQISSTCLSLRPWFCLICLICGHSIHRSLSSHSIPVHWSDGLQLAAQYRTNAHIVHYFQDYPDTVLTSADTSPLHTLVFHLNNAVSFLLSSLIPHPSIPSFLIPVHQPSIALEKSLYWR